MWQSSRGRSVTSPARSVVMYLGQQVSDMRLSEIAKACGLSSYASAGATIWQLKARLEDNKELAEAMKVIKLDLTL